MNVKKTFLFRLAFLIILSTAVMHAIMLIKAINNGGLYDMGDTMLCLVGVLWPVRSLLLTDGYFWWGVSVALMCCPLIGLFFLGYHRWIYRLLVIAPIVISLILGLATSLPMGWLVRLPPDGITLALVVVLDWRHGGGSVVS